MEIGRLQHRIVIASYQESMVPNSPNTNKLFTAVYYCWARIEIYKGLGRAYFAGAQTEQTITHKITIRYFAAVTSENWILFQGRLFRIRGVKDLDEKHRWLELRCEEVGYSIYNFTVDVNSMGDPLGQINVSL